MKFHDLWPHLETLSEPELDALYTLAGENRRFRLECFGIYVLLFGSVFAIGYLGTTAVYRSFHPSLPAQVVMASILIAGIWIAWRVLALLGRRLFNRSVMRELRRRGSPGVT